MPPANVDIKDLEVRIKRDTSIRPMDARGADGRDIWLEDIERDGKRIDSEITREGHPKSDADALRKDLEVLLNHARGAVASHDERKEIDAAASEGMAKARE